MEKRIKTAQVNLRLEPALKAAAEKAATDDRRSLTGLIEKLLVDHARLLAKQATRIQSMRRSGKLIDEVLTEAANA